MGNHLIAGGWGPDRAHVLRVGVRTFRPQCAKPELGLAVRWHDYTQAAVNPRIGVTCGANGLKPSYRAALERAGAEIVELPPETVAEVHGLLLTGGPDLEPDSYKQDRAEETGKSDPDRDRFELELARRARADGLPVLGICRGLQIVAVAFGGSLIQHVAGHSDPSLSHPVWVNEVSRLRKLTGANELTVNSRHHQIVEVAPQDFRVTAVSAEGFVEGLESTDGQFLCVQCHPEDLQEEPWARALFADLVARAIGLAARRSSRSAPDAPTAIDEAVQPRPPR